MNFGSYWPANGLLPPTLYKLLIYFLWPNIGRNMMMLTFWQDWYTQAGEDDKLEELHLLQQDCFFFVKHVFFSHSLVTMVWPHTCEGQMWKWQFIIGTFQHLFHHNLLSSNHFHFCWKMYDFSSLFESAFFNLSQFVALQCLLIQRLMKERSSINQTYQNIHTLFRLE